MNFASKLIKTKGGLTIFTESLNGTRNQPVILIMGAMNQGLFWYDLFCSMLCGKGFFVIRYDHRDTGLSSTVEFQNHPYNLNDLADDVIGILNGYKRKKAHIVGISMGGYIGQILAANLSDRVKTLSLISTTADHRPYMDSTAGNLAGKYELPFPKSMFLDYMEKSRSNPPKTASEFLANQLEGWRIMLSDRVTTEDIDEIRRLVNLSNKRNKNKFSVFNHGFAVAGSGDRVELIKNIKAPTLIIQGANDICFPVEHGMFLNRFIPNSKLEIIDDMGHMFALSQSNIISEKIFRHLKLNDAEEI